MSVRTMGRFSPKNKQGCLGRAGDRMGLCHCKKSNGISSVADCISDANACTLWLRWLSHSQWQTLKWVPGERQVHLKS